MSFFTFNIWNGGCQNVAHDWIKFQLHVDAGFN